MAPASHGMGAYPQPQVCLTNASSPAQRFTILAAGHSRDSVLEGCLGTGTALSRCLGTTDNWLGTRYYLFFDFPVVLCQCWQAFGQLSNVACSCNLAIRKEKRIIYHRYSLLFWWVFLGCKLSCCCCCCCWLFLLLSRPSNRRPVPPVLFGYLWHYLLVQTRNSAHVRTCQICKEIFKPLCNFHKSAIIVQDEIWYGKSYSTNTKE